MKEKERRVLFNKKFSLRKFLDLVIKNLNCISLRGILQFGFDINYNSLKNYYSERRLLPESLFLSLSEISKINIKKIKVKYISSNWGQVKGGKNKSK